MISSAVSASIDWFCVTIISICIRDLTTSPTRSAIRFANSDTIMASGSCTSRTIFSRSIFWPKALRRARSCLRFIAAIDFCRPPSPPESAWFSVSLPDRRLSSPPLLRFLSRLSASRSFLRIGVGAALVGTTLAATFVAAGCGAAVSALSAACLAASSAALRRASDSSAFFFASS